MYSFRCGSSICGRARKFYLFDEQMLTEAKLITLASSLFNLNTALWRYFGYKVKMPLSFTFAAAIES